MPTHHLLAYVSFQPIDWAVVVGFAAVLVGIGVWAFQTAGRDATEFFLAGRGMPWWLLGVSMVACTFAADTPNLVCGMVREDGVSKNWAWWAFLITGMVTVFIYAKLWRRSEVMTDLEFYELRYSGKPAAFLRGFRAVYLGVLFNVLIMANVTLAIIKYGVLLFGAEKWECVLYGSAGVVLYAALGGIKGCLWADLFQYTIAMIGAVATAVVAVGEAGRSLVEQGELPASGAEQFGLAELFTQPAVAERMALLPDFSDASQWMPLLLMPLLVQWWAAWYPGAEPGGGGYIAQRMLSAKDERNAVGATLFFNVAHYALRPWPWIVVALASLACFPELDDVQQAFPHVDESIIAHDIAYPAMVSKLGPGLLGVVVASIAAAYMSTIGTHLNWGSSYAVNDFYRRFVRPDATDAQLVRAGRACTVGLMVLAGVLALFLTSATQAFDILLLSGAGSGAIYLLRWFWWRINAWSEIFAMIATTIVAAILVFAVSEESLAAGPIDGATMKFLLAVATTTVAWLAGTFLTPPEDEATLRAFYRKCRPGGPGWARVVAAASASGDPVDGGAEQAAWDLPRQVLCVFVGCAGVYGLLFAIGSTLYGAWWRAAALYGVALVAVAAVFRLYFRRRSTPQ